MANLSTFILFNWGVVAALVLLILVPFLRGRSDLLTTWNFFLLGAINFIGIAGLKAGYQPEFFRVADYNSRDYQLYMAGAFTFLITLVLVYRFFKFPRRLAGRALRSWPSSDVGTLSLMIGVSLVMAVISVRPPPVPVLQQILTQIGNKFIVIAVVLAFVAWYRNKLNLLLLAVVVCVFLFSTVLAVMGGGGRRTILGVAITLPVCIYWLDLRYRNPLTNLLVLSGTGAVILFALAGYSAVRHFDRRGDKEERSAVNSFAALSQIPKQMFESSIDPLLGQNAGQCALAAIHLYTTEYEPEPFHSVLFVSTVYVPRAIWEDKPVGLGYSLPKKTSARTRATWGPSIIGHGFHEGGLHMLVFYAVLAATAMRFVDELLVRQSNNPYLLAGLSAASGHIVGWTRGDIGTFTIQILTAFAVTVAVGVIGRMILGTGMVYPRTDDPYFVDQNLFRQPVAYY